MKNSRIILATTTCLTLTELAGCGGTTTPVVEETAPTTTSPPVTTTALTTTTTPTGPSYRTLASTANPASSVAVLTVVTGGGGSAARLTGSYDHATQTTTANGTSAPLSTDKRTYVGTLTIAGGDNKIVAIPTLTSDMPTSGAATYSGTANYQSIGAGVGQTSNGSLTATLTANFSQTNGAPSGS